MDRTADWDSRIFIADDGSGEVGKTMLSGYRCGGFKIWLVSKVPLMADSSYWLRDRKDIREFGMIDEVWAGVLRVLGFGIL